MTASCRPAPRGVKRAAIGVLSAAIALPLSPFLGSSALAATPPAVQDVSGFCADVPATYEPFSDLGTLSASEKATVECLAYAGITTGGPNGLPADQYGPNLTTLRDQMASFIVRMMDSANRLDAGDNIKALPAWSGTNHFTDVPSSNVHVANINRLFEAGIVQGGPKGLPANQYGPKLAVQRDQMASFINRAVQFMTGAKFSTTNDYFTDDNGNTHEGDINGITSVGITQGGVGGRPQSQYSPTLSVIRRQMAAFLVRTLAELNDEGKITKLSQPTSTTITNANGSVAPGGTVSGTISGTNIRTVAISGPCINPTSVNNTPNGNRQTLNFSTQATSNAPNGPCTITFNITYANGATETQTQTVTVTGTQTATNLPQLVSASIQSTTPSNQNNPGTVVRYTFSRPVNVVTAADFLIYPYNWDGTQANSCNAVAATATPKLLGCGIVSFTPGSTTVDVSFPTVTNSSATANGGTAANPNPANSVVTNYTLATVRQGAATTSTGLTNPEGSAPIGSAQSTPGQTFTANVTNAPDVTNVAFGTTAPAAPNNNTTPVTFTFDQAAYITAAGAGGAAGASNTNGQTPGFYLVLPDNSQVQCEAPPQTGAQQPGGTTPGGGAGQTTITVLCPDTTNGTLLTSGTVARAFVGAGTVTSAAQQATPAGATAACQGGQFGSTSGNPPVFTAQPGPNYCNPLEAFHFGINSTGPDLTSVQGQPNQTVSGQSCLGNNNTTCDAVVYTFDQNVAAVNPANFGVFLANASEVFGNGGANGVCGTTTINANCQFNNTNNNTSTVVIYYPKGTLASATGAFVDLGGVTPQNQPDERGLQPANNGAGNTITPGTVNAPQLQSVKLVKSTTLAGTTTYSAVYTFNQPVTVANNGNFFLYAQDGTRYTAGNCTVGTTSSTNNQVTCNNYAGVSNAGGQADIYSATLGTVLQDAVTGNNQQNANTNPNPAPNANPNPEGAANTTQTTA